MPAPSTAPVIGLLALQGDFAAHAAALRPLGYATREVRTAAQLDGLRGLVLPGGESTTMLKLMEASGLAEAITRAVRSGLPVLATCAGVILAAREVVNPPQRSLGILDVTVQRNGYGRQLDSSITTVSTRGAGLDGDDTLEAVFIRAPRVLRTGPEVAVLARRGEDPVLLRQGHIIAATFHPELSPRSPVIDLFVNVVGGAA